MTAHELAAQFGLHRAGREWRGACPACGYRDAFVLADGRRGVIGWCASCDNRKAIAAVLAGSRTVATTAPRVKDVNDAQARVERAEKIWGGAVPLPDTAAAVYLQARGIGHLIGCIDLRFRPDCPHPSGTLERPVRLPALIAAVRDVNGAFIGIHRTFLRRDGYGKTEIEPAKASLGPVRGGAVRLASVERVLAAGELVIGEGVESSASAGLMLDLPAWAAISAGNLASGLMLPAGIRLVAIAADGDETGQHAAGAAWRRWRAEGRTVRIATPDSANEDFNDIVRKARS
jgi:hypothetical protein